MCQACDAFGGPSSLVSRALLEFFIDFPLVLIQVVVRSTGNKSIRNWSVVAFGPAADGVFDETHIGQNGTASDMAAKTFEEIPRIYIDTGLQ